MAEVFMSNYLDFTMNIYRNIMNEEMRKYLKYSVKYSKQDKKIYIINSL